MLIPYEVRATDLGTALNIAQRRAQNDGYTHVSIQSTIQTGPGAWTILVFASNSQGLTHRCTDPARCAH